jgi:phospholipid/cholesterol/gamma-HCH transport system substrate-binding protein
MQSVRHAARSPMFWGIATLALTVVIALVVAWVYVSPPRQQIVSFYTNDAASVSAGSTVRIAGIVVGKVKDISIEPNQVRVRASLDRDAFVGDQSQVEVRMLTVVGGYYVTINSLGDAPLGSKPIPQERVTMPYSLIRTLSDATKITNNVATRPLNDSLNELQHGLTGTNVDAVKKLLAAGNAITDVMEKQRGQLTTILDLSNEYIHRLDANKSLLEYLISRVAILEQALVLYGKGFGESLEGLGDIGKRALTPLGDFYMPRRDDFLARVKGILGEIQAIADRNGLVVRVLRRIRGRLEGTLAAQNNGMPPELFATDLCFPTEGNRC